MTQRVAADLLETWAGIWDEATRARESSALIQALAEEASSDPEQAIRAIIPVLALIHPQVAASVSAICHVAVEELRRAAGIPVTPPSHDGERVFVAVEGGRMGERGGQQQQDRLAQAEAEIAELRRQLEMEVRGRQTDRETLRSIATLAGIRLDSIG
jgi:hypothetical protein